jgi:L-Ala-D/L-Glu epimerase
MRLTAHPYTLQLRSAFNVATYSRNTTPVVLVCLEQDGIVGYGEASLPPYLGETQESVIAFLQSLRMEKFDNPFELEEILLYADHTAQGNTAAKAALDIALHDLVGKILNRPCHELWGISALQTPLSTFTLSLGTPEEVRAKAESVPHFPMLKIKLGSPEGIEQDKAIIRGLREVSHAALTIDANQGWHTKEHALEMIEWLATQNTVFIEQPLHKDAFEETAWLYERSPLPLFADESCKRLTDMRNLLGVFHGVNIKLMKSTGLREAYAMINAARALGLETLLGCMTETSCGISAASQLAPLVRYADLDGALLISNDCFEGSFIRDGSIRVSKKPGIGATPTAEALTWLH